MSTDTWQLDVFNFKTSEYECVRISKQHTKLKNMVEFLDAKAWRIWNRTTRINRPLLPKVRLVKTFDHHRRWSRICASRIELGTAISQYKKRKHHTA